MLYNHMNVSSSLIRLEVNGVQIEIERLEVWMGEIKAIFEVKRARVISNFSELNGVGGVNLSGFVNMT